jgi:hypothetical protein
MGYDIEALRRAGQDWFTFLVAKGGLDAEEQAVVAQAQAWFAELQTTHMSKSYKMVTVEVLLAAEALTVGMSLEELAERARQCILRSPELLTDLQGVKAIPDLGRVPPHAWQAYWRENPIHHWINRGDPSWFRVEEGRFVPELPKVPGREGLLAAMTRELVDYRLAKYRARSREPRPGELSFFAKVTWNQRNPILNLPQADSRPRGTVQVRLPGGEIWAFHLKAQFCNVAHPVNDGRNHLPDLLREWFGPDAGKPGTQFRLHFARNQDGWKVKPLAITMPTVMAPGL